MRSTIVIILFFAVSVFVVFNRDQQHHNLYGQDKCGYYIYLPATFIYHDIWRLSFYDSLNSKYSQTFSLRQSLYPVNGGTINKYTSGVAMFEAPLFLLAHAFCKVSNWYDADGFSLPYQVAGIFSTIIWVIAGLFVLRRFLKKYFSDAVVAITLLCMAFGTNLYAYTAFDLNMSHPYSFFLFCSVLQLTDSIITTKRVLLDSIVLGVIMGLIFLVRPVNIVVIIVPLHWGIISLKTLKQRVNVLYDNYGYAMAGVLCFTLIALIQFSYWKHITGHWLYYSYQHERFNFSQPSIIQGLFSYRKGWLVYTPMALAGIVGFYPLAKKYKYLVPTLVAYLLLVVYITFSWEQWWYGSSFGCRPLIECLAILSLPLAALIESVYRSISILKKIAMSLFFTALITLNIFQTYQYSMGTLHWSRMTRAYYWKLFGRIDFDRVSNERYLIPEKDAE